MKKNTIAFVMIVLVLISFVSCGNNYEFNEEEMKTLGGETILLKEREDVLYSEDFGFGFVVPPNLLEKAQTGSLEIIPLSMDELLFVVYSNGIFDLMASIDPSNVTEEEYLRITQEIPKYAFEAATIIKTPIEDDKEQAIANLKEKFSIVEEIAKTKLYRYYLGYNEDLSNTIVKDEEKESFNLIIEELRVFKENIFVFNPTTVNTTPSSENIDVNFSMLNTEDLDGNTVDASIFADYDITMVNVWATWCGPCINEMPELAKLHGEMLPENANMITILIDVPDGIETAKEIVSSSNGEFTTLLANESFESFLSTVTAVPTTIFVDSNGTIVGQPILGAPPTDPAGVYLQKIEEVLESINK